MTYCDASSSGTSTLTLHDSGSASINSFGCFHHQWVVRSLRGSNRNQRVEHVECAVCGERATKVWKQGMNQPRPDHVYRDTA